MRVDDFDYHLPEELIALRPASPRDAARLLVVEPGADPPFADRMIADLPELALARRRARVQRHQGDPRRA